MKKPLDAKRSGSRVVGIDEAGRGPLAGPVAVGAVAIDPRDTRLRVALKKIFPKIRDSKQLSASAREVWFREIRKLGRNGGLSWSVAMVSASVIDKKGIVEAISIATTRVLLRVNGGTRDRIILDGGLKAPETYKRQKTFIRGDATYLPIALASVVAKVTRDRHMKLMGKRYPKHGFEVHKGYGTRKHYASIRKHGKTPIHRRTFLKGP